MVLWTQTTIPETPRHNHSAHSVDPVATINAKSISTVCSNTNKPGSIGNPWGLAWDLRRLASCLVVVALGENLRFAISFFSRYDATSMGTESPQMLILKGQGFPPWRSNFEINIFHSECGLPPAAPYLLSDMDPDRFQSDVAPFVQRANLMLKEVDSDNNSLAHSAKQALRRATDQLVRFFPFCLDPKEKLSYATRFFELFHLFHKTFTSGQKRTRTFTHLTPASLSD